MIAELVQNNLCYDKETGVFTWKSPKQGRKMGVAVGSKSPSGYLVITIGQKSYWAHRLAWIYCHGEIQENMVIDHINGVRNDNRIVNLRPCSHSENMQNRGISHTPSRLNKLLRENT